MYPIPISNKMAALGFFLIPSIENGMTNGHLIDDLINDLTDCLLGFESLINMLLFFLSIFRVKTLETVSVSVFHNAPTFQKKIDILFQLPIIC